MIELLKKSWKKILITFGLIAGMIVSVLAFVFSQTNNQSDKLYQEELDKIKKEKVKSETIIHESNILDFNNDGTLKPKSRK